MSVVARVVREFHEGAEAVTLARCSSYLPGPKSGMSDRATVDSKAASVTGAFPASQRATETTPSNCEECDTDDQDECRQPVTYDYRIGERGEPHPHVDIIADHRRCQRIAARETKPPWYKREQGARDNHGVDRKQYGPEYFMAVVDEKVTGQAVE